MTDTTDQQVAPPVGVPSQTTATDGAGNPITIIMQQPGTPPIVTPTPDMDVTQEGGAYRKQDGSYTDAEGRPLDKKPKGMA